MNKLLAVVVLTVFVCGLAAADTEATEPKPGLPKSLEDFQKQIADKATDPKAAVKLWFDAVYVYLLRDKELGKQLILEMDRYKEWDSRPFRTFRSQMDQMPYIMFSYAKAATPENQYAFDPDDYEIVIGDNINMKPFADKAEGEYCKLFVKSNGADSPRPVTLIANKRGEWKFYEFSSLYVGVRKPYEAVIWETDIPESTDPVWTFHQWLKGILMHLNGDEAGADLMNSLMKEPDPTFKTFHMTISQDKSYIWRSYVKGTSPENQYAVPDVTNFEIDTYFQPGEAPTETSTAIRMFVRSSGADNARPMRLEKDERGQWRMSEYSSLCVGIRKPVDPNAGEF